MQKRSNTIENIYYCLVLYDNTDNVMDTTRYTTWYTFLVG